jgi:hypothetical protein
VSIDYQASYTNLFLRSSSLVTLGLIPLLPDTKQPSFAPCLPQSPVGMLLTLGHLASFDLLEMDPVGDGQGVTDATNVVFSLLDLRGRGVVLLVLADFSREEDETGVVSLETGDVDGERLGREVLSSMID